MHSSLVSASSALFCLFFHTQKNRDVRAHMNPHSYSTSIMLFTLCRIAAQANITNVNWDVRLQDFILTSLPVSSGYGFVDFDSPAAAQKAVTALKSTGIQAQMAKVRIHGRIILISPPLSWTFHNKVPNCGSYLSNSSKCWPYSLSVGCRMIWPTWFSICTTFNTMFTAVSTRWLQPASFPLHVLFWGS